MTLPPLPEMVVIDQHIPSGYAIRGYTSKEMYAYGQQCREAAALRKAAQAVVDRWDTPLWKDVPATAEYINELREALK